MTKYQSVVIYNVPDIVSGQIDRPRGLKSYVVEDKSCMSDPLFLDREKKNLKNRTNDI